MALEQGLAFLIHFLNPPFYRADRSGQSSFRQITKRTNFISDDRGIPVDQDEVCDGGDQRVSVNVVQRLRPACVEDGI
jgi:hypothetical protein